MEVVEALDGYILEFVARSANLTMADYKMVYGSCASFQDAYFWILVVVYLVLYKLQQVLLIFIK